MESSLLDMRNLRFTWPNSESETINIELMDIQAGDHVFIQGPSGSGKSTLLNLIGGLLLPSSGSVSLCGVDMESLNYSDRDKNRADNIGYIFQQFNLVPYLDPIANISLPCMFSASRRSKAIDRSGSVHAEARRLLVKLFNDESELQNKNVVNLSVGQQQRVAAARALIGEPALVIADEPTSALDQVNTDLFMDLLFQELEQSHSTLLFVSHDSRLKAKFESTIDLQSINGVVG